MDDFGDKRLFSIYLGRKCGKAVWRVLSRPFSFFVGGFDIGGILFLASGADDVPVNRRPRKQTMANQDMSSIIVERRKALRMTQRDLAEKLNVSD